MVDGNQKILTPSLMAGPGKKNTLQPYSYDPEYARQQLAYMIIMHEYPLNMVEHVGFKRFCYALQPSFQVVSRNTIKRDILNIYDVERLKTMRLMEKNRNRIFLTMDMWTAAMLDPRFKMSLIECYYTDIYGFRGVEMVENIKTRCYDLLTVYEGKNDKNLSEASSNPPPSTDGDLGRYALFLNSRKKGEAMSGNPFPTINDDDMDTDEYISDVTCVDD
ncbi:hypothetical protein Vadar_020827 [Vaccinium darrowii]|uniref:Uncharacterized protein n=1 Tax=Vaccinium darrowii TaxID=229202 RepID=A0ACB7Z5H5_9ERIC|nr:hypothetical protein Vadar_020827 [Vaccinium darrowii]